MADREARRERLLPEPLCQVAGQLVCLEHEPGAESTDITVRDIRTVV
jgi:hypothetical protein